MKVIGITGGIGSGKSIVSSVFRHLGIPVYDADRAVHGLYEKHPELVKRIVEEVSPDVVDAKGRIDRKRLGAVVFADESLLKRLNRIVHPAVRKDFKEWMALHRSAPYVLKEAAILFESGTDKDCDFVITVVAPVELRVQRIRDRDQRSIAEIRKVIEKQSTDEYKMERSRFVIRNSAEEMVLPQVLAIHEEILAYLKQELQGKELS
ncbi:MAG: dephospho-CoA kinase [Bacteroidota bacterium]